MTYFAIHTQAIKNQTEPLSGIYRELLNEAKEIQQCASNLNFNMSGIWRVKTYLRSLSDATERNAATMNKLQQTLTSVVSLYENTEKKITGDSALSSNSNSRTSDESNADTSSIEQNRAYAMA